MHRREHSENVTRREPRHTSRSRTICSNDLSVSRSGALALSPSAPLDLRPHRSSSGSVQPAPCGKRSLPHSILTIVGRRRASSPCSGRVSWTRERPIDSSDGACNGARGSLVLQIRHGISWRPVYIFYFVSTIHHCDSKPKIAKSPSYLKPLYHMHGRLGFASIPVKSRRPG